MRYLSATLLACFALSAGAVWAQDAPPTLPAAPVAAPDAGAGAVAPAGAIQIALPFNKAIVRESVPVNCATSPPEAMRPSALTISLSRPRRCPKTARTPSLSGTPRPPILRRPMPTRPPITPTAPTPSPSRCMMPRANWSAKTPSRSRWPTRSIWPLRRASN